MDIDKSKVIKCQFETLHGMWVECELYKEGSKWLIHCNGTIINADTVNVRKEIWVDIPGFDGKYIISNLGKVKSFKRKNPLTMKIRYSKSGYLVITLTKVGYHKVNDLHRLLMKSFRGIPEGMQVNHINGIKSDYSLYNLEVVTASENHKHAWRTGLQTSYHIKKVGSENNKARKVKCLQTGRIFETLSEAGRWAEVSASGITLCCQGKIKTSGGYKWNYV